MHFHHKTIDRRRLYEDLETLFDDELFFEYLYATLTSWGLHRMGKRKTKLVDFDVFIRSIQAQKSIIIPLQNKNILSISKEELHNVVEKLWEILENIKASISAVKLVANSKTLHHILPELIPPIDRQYTLRFFRNSKELKHDEQIFREIYPHFHYIGLKNKSVIQPLIGTGFHTSVTKLIDNALVGYVLSERI